MTLAVPSRADSPRGWPLFLAAALLVAAIFRLAWPRPPLTDLAGTALPETSLTGAGDRVGPILAALGSAGRRLYVLAQVVDLAFIRLFAAGMTRGIGTAGARLRAPWAGWLVVLPAGAALAGLMEDVALVTATTGHPTQPVSPALISAVATLNSRCTGYVSLCS